MKTTEAIRRLKMWLELRNDCAKRPAGYLIETKLRARERARLWLGIAKEEKRVAANGARMIAEMIAYRKEGAK